MRQIRIMNQFKITVINSLQLQRFRQTVQIQCFMRKGGHIRQGGINFAVLLYEMVKK